MKKIKLAFWIVFLGLLGLVVFQNRVLLLEYKQQLSIDLAFNTYQTPELPMALFFAVVFLLGWLIAFFSGLVERFRTGKTIKKLRETIHSQENAIDAMKKDIEALKPRTEVHELIVEEITPEEADAATIAEPSGEPQATRG